MMIVAYAHWCPKIIQCWTTHYYDGHTPNARRTIMRLVVVVAAVVILVAAAHSALRLPLPASLFSATTARRAPHSRAWSRRPLPAPAAGSGGR
eukprot:SAG11_NODE_3_length_39220_cov_67.005828_11_plen_93_part_00